MSPILAACPPAILFPSLSPRAHITCAAVRELAFPPCTYYMCLGKGARLSGCTRYSAWVGSVRCHPSWLLVWWQALVPCGLVSTCRNSTLAPWVPILPGERGITPPNTESSAGNGQGHTCCHVPVSPPSLLGVRGCRGGGF